MLTLRRDQLTQLRDVARVRFLRRMIGHLRRRFPQRTLGVSDDLLTDAIDHGCRNAERFGIVFDSDVRRFIECCMTYGTQLDGNDETGWIVEVLARTDLDGTQKMDVIDSRELQRLRASP